MRVAGVGKREIDLGEKVHNVLIVLVLFSSVVYAQGKSASKCAAPESRGEIPIHFEVGTSAEAQQIYNKYQGELDIAFRLVKESPPDAGDTIFSWRKSTPRIPVSGIAIYWTTSNDPAFVSLGEGESTDAVTVFFERVGPGTPPFILVFFLMDRILSDEYGREREDGLVRATVALAHELYGHVKGYLKRDLTAALDRSPKSKREKEIEAIQAGISFLNNVISQPSKLRNFPHTVEQMKSALTREKRTLASWKK